LPGIGPTKANAIITYRDTKGPFLSIEDLLFVDGIGESTFEQIKDFVFVILRKWDMITTIFTNGDEK
jgi:competence protein ComEA